MTFTLRQNSTPTLKQFKLPCFMDERQLIADLPSGTKVVDFLLADCAGNVFVDAKGVEMAYQGKVSHRPDIILDKV